MDINKLIELSEGLTEELLDQLDEVDITENNLLAAELEWDSCYYEIVLGETDTPPPGGGRWNDTKRLGWAKEVYPKQWDTFVECKERAREAECGLKMIKGKISGLNRIIRLLEIANANPNT